MPLWTLSLWMEVKINLFFPELFLVIVFYHGNRKADNKVGVYTHTHAHETYMHNFCLSEGYKIDDFQAKKGRGWCVYRWACGFLWAYMLRRKGPPTGCSSLHCKRLNDSCLVYTGN